MRVFRSNFEAAHIVPVFIFGLIEACKSDRLEQLLSVQISPHVSHGFPDARAQLRIQTGAAGNGVGGELSGFPQHT